MVRYVAVIDNNVQLLPNCFEKKIYTFFLGSSIYFSGRLINVLSPTLKLFTYTALTNTKKVKLNKVLKQ